MTVTTRDLRRRKSEGRRFAMLTAYDYTTALLATRAGIPVLLVGDSLGNVILGHATTVPVTVDDICHHCRAVARGATEALIVGDLPFLSYQASVERAVLAAQRLMQEGGAHAVKMEGAGPTLEVVRRLTSAGVPVMAHLGLTPQSVHLLGGFRVQGRGEAGDLLLRNALDLQEAGAFALVLEAVPSELAEIVTSRLEIPTIGIGAGPHCDGQVLVVNDMLGLTDRTARFVKRYAELGEATVQAMRAYADDVEQGTFPGPEHTYGAAARSHA